jgi:DNA primase large subunit
LEEALVYWRRGFSQLTDDKFQKEYKYNIRHSYGQEGKRMNYPAKRSVPLEKSLLQFFLTKY